MGTGQTPYWDALEAFDQQVKESTEKSVVERPYNTISTFFRGNGVGGNRFSKAERRDAIAVMTAMTEQLKNPSSLDLNTLKPKLESKCAATTMKSRVVGAAGFGSVLMGVLAWALIAGSLACPIGLGVIALGMALVVAGQSLQNKANDQKDICDQVQSFLDAAPGPQSR